MFTPNGSKFDPVVSLNCHEDEPVWRCACEGIDRHFVPFFGKWWPRPHVFDEKWKWKNQKCRRTESVLSLDSSIVIETQRFNVYLGVSNVTKAWHAACFMVDPCMRQITFAGSFCFHPERNAAKQNFSFQFMMSYWEIVMLRNNSDNNWTLLLQASPNLPVPTCACACRVGMNELRKQQNKIWEMRIAHVSTSSRTRNTKHCCQQRLNLTRVVTQAAARLSLDTFNHALKSRKSAVMLRFADNLFSVRFFVVLSCAVRYVCECMLYQRCVLPSASKRRLPIYKMRCCNFALIIT